MKKWQMQLLAWVVILGGGAVCGLGTIVLTWLLGAGKLSVVFGLTGLLSWFAIYAGVGLTFVTEKDFRVVERLGTYHLTLRGGWHILCLPGLIDKFAPHGGEDGTFEQVIIEVTAADMGGEVVFLGGSSGTPEFKIVAQVIDSDRAEIEIPTTVTGTPTPDKITGAPSRGHDDPCYLFVYVVEDTPARIKSLAIEAVRRIIQGYNVDDAALKTGEISQKVLWDRTFLQALANIGVRLCPESGITLKRIALPESVKKDREGVLSAEKEALGHQAKGRGHALAILAIIDEAAKPVFAADGVTVVRKGRVVSWRAAEAIYRSQNVLDMLEKQPPATINMVAENTGGILLNIDPSNKK
ncbi:MAG: SPFH domain-containing protein [Candidatus Paceibacterota bacterium]